MSEAVARPEWDDQLGEYRVLHVGCGTDQPDKWLNVDLVPDCEPDIVWDIEDTPWPLSEGSVRELVARHVVEHLHDVDAFFEEAARVLEVGGYLHVTVPVGENQVEDPTHRNSWAYRTPERFARGNQHWDGDSEFVLCWRELDLYLGGPFYHLSPVWNVVARRWPRWGVHRSFGGEMTAVFRRGGRR